MPLKIKDSFTRLKVSRQRKYQLRKKRLGLCIICGKKAHLGTVFCYDCNLKRGIRHPGRNKGKKLVKHK